jgi:DNA mismatch repair protein MutS
MSFIADKQTTDDLNLTGRYRADSIFSLFNRCRLSGGEQLLESMFRTPLTDREAISQRVTLLQYFRQQSLHIPFTNEQLNKAKDYIEQGAASRYRPVAALLLWKKKVMETAVKDEAYNQVVAGIRATIAILQQLHQFIQSLDEQGPFREQLTVVKNLLASEAITDMLQHKSADSLSLQEAARYDHLLKHTYSEQLEKVIQVIYELDVYTAVAAVAQEHGFHFAKVLPADNDRLQITGLYHPRIAAGVAVPNDLSLDAGTNTFFLTGANMAGKSTFMKAFGIAMYLAHMGFPVAARSMEFSVREGMYSSINVADNLALGYSHFYAEVLRVKKVAADVSSGKRLVVIFDELFKGTNVKDAYDATLAVTQAFTDFHRCWFLVSTHITEVGEALQQTNTHVQYAYLPTIMEGAIPRYTYRLAGGISSDRHGMTIIENEKILDIIHEGETSDVKREM